MADCCHEHHATVILDGGNDPVVADSIAPQSLAVAGQRMGEAARVVASGNALAQIAQNPLLSVM
jgi:hypothetical protein